MAMESPEIVSRIAEMTEHLEPMPQIATKVMEMVGDPDTSCEMLASTISRDPALASRILSLANTPYYRRLASITSLNTAVMVLGFGTIQSLVLTIAVGIMFGGATARKTLTQIWEHSVATALISETLGRRLALSDQERCYIAGLLHDVGKLVFCKALPDRFKEVLKKSKSERVPCFEAEKNQFGFDHAQLGEAVLQKWNLPDVYRVPVANHHELAALEPTEILTPLVHVADRTAYEILGSEDEQKSPLDPLATERLGLKETEVVELVSEEREVVSENLQLIARL